MTFCFQDNIRVAICWLIVDCLRKVKGNCFPQSVLLNLMHFNMFNQKDNVIKIHPSSFVCTLCKNAPFLKGRENLSAHFLLQTFPKQRHFEQPISWKSRLMHAANSSNVFLLVFLRNCYLNLFAIKLCQHISPTEQTFHCARAKKMWKAKKRKKKIKVVLWKILFK